MSRKSTFVDRFAFHLARAMTRLPPRLQLLLSGRVPVVRDGQRLHPELQLLLAVAARSGSKWSRGTTPAAVRRRLEREASLFGGPPVPIGAVRDLVIEGATGKLRARHYAPAPAPTALGAERAPLLVFLHGGGFVFGTVDTHDAPCRLLCRHGGVQVLSVEYRLAPEHPFPAAVLDAGAAFRWAQAHAEELGADPRRVGIGGDSAGGNLAAVVSHEARRAGEPLPACQVLIYPTLDSSKRHASRELFAEGFFLTRDAMDWFHQQYAETAGASVTDVRLSPLLVEDASGLPPTLLVTAAMDPLRDEGEAYAARLRAAGTPVVARRFEGQIHGFINLVGISRASRDAMIEVAGATRTLFAIAGRGAAPRTRVNERTSSISGREVAP